MQSFFRLAKLKVHFKDQYSEELNTEDQVFRPLSNKKWAHSKNHHTIETYIKATERELVIKDTTNYLKVKELL